MWPCVARLPADHPAAPFLTPRTTNNEICIKKCQQPLSLVLLGQKNSLSRISHGNPSNTSRKKAIYSRSRCSCVVQVVPCPSCFFVFCYDARARPCSCYLKLYRTMKYTQQSQFDWRLAIVPLSAVNGVFLFNSTQS